MGGQRRANGQDHGIVQSLQLIQRHITANAHVAQKPHVGPGERALELADDVLCAQMIGRNTGADKAERGWKTVDDVNGDVRALAGDGVNGVQPRGAAADDTHACSG